MASFRDPTPEASRRLEEVIRRQRFVCAKLRRDGCYSCEIQAAQRALRSCEAQLRAARRRRSAAPARVSRRTAPRPAGRDASG